jgi:hypothetical protein
MPDETNWITTRIDAAKKIYPVTDAVATRLAVLLKDQLADRQLPSAEALTIARLLILDMASLNQSGSEEKP